MEKYFTWNQAEHGKFFPNARKRTSVDENEKEAKKRQAQIEQVKNDKLYGEDDE